MFRRARNSLIVISLLFYSSLAFSGWNYYYSVSLSTAQAAMDSCISTMQYYITNYGYSAYDCRLPSGSKAYGYYWDGTDDPCATSGGIWDQNALVCEPDSDGDGIPDSEDPNPCPQNTYWDSQLQSCESLPQCENGMFVYSLAYCDLPEFKCYDGTVVNNPEQCPEFIPPEPDEPEGEPNGVCESGSYSYASVDPDCRAPEPQPCPGECKPDSTAPDEDHDGDGTPNVSDPDADSDGDGIPNGKDTTPNGSDGTSGTGTGGQGFAGDSDGDGISDDKEADDPDGNTSGGDSCQTPPQCTDDAIQCAILRDTWKNRCNTDFKVEGNYSCDTEIKCEGDVLQCASLKSAQRQRCSEIVASDSVIASMNQDLLDIEAETASATVDENGMLIAIDSGDVSLASTFDTVTSVSKEYSAACPAVNTDTLSFGTFFISYDPICELMDKLAPFVRLLSSLAAALIFFRTQTS